MGRIASYLKGLALGVLVAWPAHAGEATVAVASNFLSTARALETAFEADGTHQINLAHGSTGRLFAQIVSGAPFDVFLSADAVRPEALLVGGKAVETRGYALGTLVLVARDAGEAPIPELLRNHRIALANPEIAPYGAAALDVLAFHDLDPATLDLVQGDNVGQAASIFVTGNADRAFLAAAQVPLLDNGLTVIDLTGQHGPIRQDAALLTHGAENPAARSFFNWLGDAEASAIMTAAGYGVLP